MKMISISALPLALLAAVMLGCSGDTNESQNAAPETSRPQTAQQPAVGASPSFTLLDASGNIHNADEWIGKRPVVVNFWGTWCPPCRREIPDMVRVYEEYKDRVEIVGIALNDTPDKVTAYAGQAGMSWPLLIGDPQVAIQFGIQSVPTTFFFDAEGNLVEVEDSDGSMTGALVGSRDYATFKRAIETIIRESDRPS